MVEELKKRRRGRDREVEAQRAGLEVAEAAEAVKTELLKWPEFTEAAAQALLDGEVSRTGSVVFERGGERYVVQSTSAVKGFFGASMAIEYNFLVHKGESTLQLMYHGRKSKDGLSVDGGSSELQTGTDRYVGADVYLQSIAAFPEFFDQPQPENGETVYVAQPTS